MQKFPLIMSGVVLLTVVHSYEKHCKQRNNDREYQEKYVSAIEVLFHQEVIINLSVGIPML